MVTTSPSRGVIFRSREIREKRIMDRISIVPSLFSSRLVVDINPTSPTMPIIMVTWLM